LKPRNKRVKQILQSLKSGETELADIPCPTPKRGQLLIRTRQTLVSAGTERMLVEFGKGNLIEKARQQPDKVKQVIEKAKTDGVIPTLEAVRNKLDQALPMGYCNVGEVLETGAGVTGFAVGDRVASNGKHAEAVNVPVNLCAKIPDNVSDEAAAFTVLGAIALQGIRLVQPTLGEAVVVTGLGLIGLVAVQLLRAQGCRVLGLDFDPAKLALARQLGAETVDLTGQDPLAAAQAFSRGRGVDAVLITAATKSNEPMHQAAQMCRKRGRIVLVGVTGLELSRADFYEKELSFQVSCSYGPGRYDPNYEEGGQDYPVGFVRWTEQRNFEAVLDMLADGRLDVAPLISHRFAIEEAEQAYELVGGSAPSLGILLQYPTPEQKPETELRADTVRLRPAAPAAGKASMGFIGAGNYASAVLIPAFKATGARLKTVASAAGVSGAQAAKKFGFEETTTATDKLFDDADINAVVITTRHNSHAALVCQALQAGKAVFVEKPLALSYDELALIETAYNESASPLLMVGFNRRFSPQAVKMKSLLQGLGGPKAMVMTVNAGAIPQEHWTQDCTIGGGRIIGEACHFVDLLRYLAGAPIIGMQAAAMGDSEDVTTFTLQFADGSTGTVHYLANGHKAVPKERLEVFCGGRILQLDNFRKLTGFGWSGFSKMNLWRQDKGQLACATAFVQAIEKGGAAPVAFEELLEISRVTIDIAEAVRRD
jgi:predicted dehydrogenase/threonine dehydrogenase-like Zn-dependent dehydrogenase